MLNIVCIGAHPDDCEFHAGGTAVKWAKLGHRVLFVSMTNGDAGHHEMSGGALARRRAREAQIAAGHGGAKELILDNHDGELEATLEVRKEVVSIIRRWRADIVLTHRPNDYHPDHRYTSIAVQDAAFMVTVPNFCAETPRLERNPVFLYLMDHFTKPYPFQADVAVAVDDVMDVKWQMLDAMESQVYEWLPWLANRFDEVPTDKDERLKWLQAHWNNRFQEAAEYARPALDRWYGARAASKVQFAEAFEICEYGHQPSPGELRQLFPFFPDN
ncbi:MAG: PIG-L family deacetylase [Candidatus Hydrogenedentes bacterium]|nr:PIG-L family deacetylase [Candidatus Hydrogenedentota bacterium]